MGEIFNRLRRKVLGVEFVSERGFSLWVRFPGWRKDFKLQHVTGEAVMCWEVDGEVLRDTPAARWIAGVAMGRTRNDDGDLS